MMESTIHLDDPESLQVANSDRYRHSLWGNIRAMDFSIDGKHLAITEETSILRLYPTSRYLQHEDSVQLPNEHLVDPYAISCHKSIFVCSSSNNVLLFSLPDGKFIRILTRHTLQVRAVAISQDGNYVASGSDDHLVRLTEIDSSQNTMEFNMHEAPISSLAFDPLGSLLTSVANDGKVCHWSIDKKQLVSTLDISRKLKGTTAIDVPIVRWSPNGKFIATNGPGNEIVLVQRNQTVPHTKLNEHSKPVTSLDWSSQGRYLASVSMDKSLVVWDIDTLSVLYQQSLTLTPSHVRWQPFQPHLAIAFDSQILMILTVSVEENQLLLTKKQELFGEDSSDSEVRMEEGEESDLDDFIVDDEKEDKSRMEKKLENKVKLRHAGFTETTPMQPAFQPGTTPNSSEKYYLAFNMHGVIFAVPQDVVTSYHIERHDRYRHKPIQFTDAREFTLAALSNVAAAFACAPENELLGSVYTRILDPWSTQSDWSFMIPPQESPLGIAVGEAIVLVTDTFIRIFTLGGMPLHVLSFSGVFVSICAQVQVCVWITHVAAPFNGNQQLSYTVLDMQEGQCISEGRTPLSSLSTLTWLGLSDTLLPLTLDSKGILRGVSPIGHWTPLLNIQTLEKDPTFHFFAVGLVDSTFLCLVCKSQYPGFPRPALSEYPCDIPVQPQLEQQFHQQRFFKPHNIKANEKLILQLIQSACQNELFQRALDLVPLLTLPVSFSKAIQIALFYQMNGLAEKIMKLQKQRETESLEIDSFDPLPPPPTPIPTSFSSQSTSQPTLFLEPSKILPVMDVEEPTKRLSPAFMEVEVPAKKAKFNPFLKKSTNPFLEKLPSLSIQHTSLDNSNPMKQASLTQFVKPQKQVPEDE